MGKPAFPTVAQIGELRKAAQLPAAQRVRISGDTLQLTLQPQALALIEVGH